MNYKVLILTSGTGSRLHELTVNLNKALVAVAGKATISYIIESYPKNVVFVVTLGYLGEQVKEFLLKNHSDRKIEFVWVYKYSGDGSSQGYSTLQAKNNLQCPFIFHCCDTIVVETIPLPDYNWVAGYIVDKNDAIDVKQYRGHKVSSGKLIKLNDKGILGSDSLHIGLIGIYDYKTFWESLEELYADNPNNQSLGDVPVIEEMIKKGFDFERIPYKVWLDTGNMDALKKTEEFLFSNRQV